MSRHCLTMAVGRPRSGECSDGPLGFGVPHPRAWAWRKNSIVWDKTARFLTGRTGAILKRKLCNDTWFCPYKEGLVAIYGSLYRLRLQIVPS